MFDDDFIELPEFYNQLKEEALLLYNKQTRLTPVHKLNYHYIRQDCYSIHPETSA